MRTGSRGRWIGLAVGLVILAGGTVWWLSSSDGGSTARADTAGVATATVERRNLVERETLDGSLGFADEAALPSARAGTLTRIADEGAIVKRGGVLFEIDERPTVLLLGAVPAYRSLSSGVEGGDVRQLQRNLLALGYGGDALEVTGVFDADSAEAVRDWQEDLGLERSGVVELGDVVFEPGPRRMGAHTVEVGAGVAAAGQVATTTSAARVVTMSVAASDQDLVAAGDRVQVELPGGERVDGRVATVARVAEADPEDPTAEPTVAVTIRLLGTVETQLDEAPVDVDVETGRAEAVLAVPVQALLALSEGGYAVEVVDGPTASHLVGVETGAFADGFVEIAGEGLAEGTEVVTAS